MAEVKIFRITGSFKQGWNVTSFLKEISEVTEENAIAKLRAELGSRNRLKQGQIKISNVEIISNGEVTDPMLKKFLETEIKIPYKE